MKGKYLIIGFFLAQVMDVLSTYLGIYRFHLMEINPIAFTLFIKIGVTEIMVVKLLLSYLIVLLYAFSMHKFKVIYKALERSLQIASVGIWGVVGINLFGVFSSLLYH